MAIHIGSAREADSADDGDDQPRHDQSSAAEEAAHIAGLHSIREDDEAGPENGGGERDEKQDFHGDHAFMSDRSRAAMVMTEIPVRI